MNREEYNQKREVALLERKLNPKKFESGSLRVPLPCIYRSETPTEWASCGCHVYDCEIHERCVPWRKGKLVDGIRVCDECLERRATYPAYDGSLTRHLIYHIYPVSGNGAWQRNVSRLCERLRIVNGKKIVTIVIDPDDGRKSDPKGQHAPDRGRHIAKCDSPGEVIKSFGDHAKSIDFIIAENDPSLREVKTLMPMLEMLPRGQGDVTLYAQAKGTTRPANHIAHHWTETLYILYFDYWLLVEQQLKDKPITGAYKKHGAGWSKEQSYSDWHYSGSWFWFRNADLFAREWRKIDQFWSGIEPYPSQQFRYDESGCLFHEAPVHDMNLYRRSDWKTLDKRFAEWRTANLDNRTPF